VTLCVLGLYTIAATHHHHTAAEENACPICHVFAHQPLDVPVPPMAAVLVALVLLFALPRRQIRHPVVRFRWTPYHSRAPPRGGVA
jgi:hypothetical protein